MLRLLFGSCGWSAAIAEDGREAERLARKRQGIALGMEDGRLSVYRGDGGERLHGPRLELLCAAVDLLGGEKVIWTDALSGEAMERLAKRHGARVERLPERERQIIALRYFHDLTQEKCAAIVGVSQVQVSRLERRAMASLREMLS